MVSHLTPSKRQHSLQAAQCAVYQEINIRIMTPSIQALTCRAHHAHSCRHALCPCHATCCRGPDHEPHGAAVGEVAAACEAPHSTPLTCGGCGVDREAQPARINPCPQSPALWHVLSFSPRSIQTCTASWIVLPTFVAGTRAWWRSGTPRTPPSTQPSNKGKAIAYNRSCRQPATCNTSSPEQPNTRSSTHLAGDAPAAVRVAAVRLSLRVLLPASRRCRECCLSCHHRCCQHRVQGCLARLVAADIPWCKGLDAVVAQPGILCLFVTLVVTCRSHPHVTPTGHADRSR